jgi:hypothetical protein
MERLDGTHTFATGTGKLTVQDAFAYADASCTASGVDNRAVGAIIHARATATSWA